MAYIFRGISKAKWNKDQRDFSWLQPDDLVADVFNDLRTQDGALSIYVVDENKANLNRIIAALACTKDSLQNFDYALAPLTIVETQFDLEKTDGTTADNEVNGWHLDIVHLTPQKLSDLTYIFRDHRESMGRMLKKKVETEIRLGLEQGYIDINRVKPTLRQYFT